MNIDTARPINYVETPSRRGTDIFAGGEEMSRTRAYATLAGCAAVLLTTTIASSIIEALVQ